MKSYCFSKNSFLVLTLLMVLFSSSIHAQKQSVHDIDLNENGKGTFTIGKYKGSKLLIVNIASGSKQASQFEELKQLKKWFKDSGLVVIAVASNSFNNEPKSNAEIQGVFKPENDPKLIVIEKAEILGTAAMPLYQWLTSKEKNGVLDTEVKSDFQKYLIDSNGNLVGVYSSRITPMSVVLLNAIRQTK